MHGPRYQIGYKNQKVQFFAVDAATDINKDDYGQVGEFVVVEWDWNLL
jgi:hypothetical protein